LYGNRRSLRQEEFKTGIHHTAVIFFWDTHVLQQPDRIANYCRMNVFSCQIFQKRLEIRPDQPRMRADTIAQRPGSTLRDPVFALEEQPDQRRKTSFIVTDKTDDTVGLLFAVFFPEQLLQIDRHGRMIKLTK